MDHGGAPASLFTCRSKHKSKESSKLRQLADRVALHERDMLASRFLSRIRKRAVRPEQPAEPSLPRSSTSQYSSSIDIMGNAPSAPNSPNRKPSQVSRSSTASSSSYMPGAETPRAVSHKDGQDAGRAEPVVGYRLEVDLQTDESNLGDSKPGGPTEGAMHESPKNDGSGLETPRPLSVLVEETTVSQVDSPRSSNNLEQLEAGLASHRASAHVEHAHHESRHDQEVHERHDQPAVSRNEAAATGAAHGWMPGRHVLLNARSGTALDLSGADQRALVGFPAHMGQNQQWEFIPSGRGYTIRSACSSSCGLYLTVENLCENAPIVASPFPASWNVRIDEKEGAMCISWPNTDFVMDLADWGSATPGTKVQLMREKPGEPCQLWRFTRCAPAEDQEEKIASSAPPPMITETVIVSEGKDHITTTRTTTTTTITTVTTVTRTARGANGVVE